MLGAFAVATAVSLLLTGCPISGQTTKTAGQTIVKFFGAHVDEFKDLDVAAAKAKVSSTVDEGLKIAVVADARTAEVNAVYANQQQDEAFQKVCNIAVDFSAPTYSADEEDQTEAKKLMSAMAGESPTNSVKQWSERVVNAYDAVWGAPDAQTQAQLKLLRDIEVFGFQQAYCRV
ncbi:hypothetical protein [Cryobacterium sp. Hz9]|uniref:hypothetical protein n=1 Tax=Cryobacterium sp. Hz9 TaxID=1259167 RepID=UPI00106B7452|nr:hypothetical protein [Cryobacterium sp. Hz9]TFB66144.1 hypothetical protein E3N85_09860 [Cryobacterium sp. Hz9]